MPTQRVWLLQPAASSSPEWTTGTQVRIKCNSAASHHLPLLSKPYYFHYTHYYDAEFAVSVIVSMNVCLWVSLAILMIPTHLSVCDSSGTIQPRDCDRRKWMDDKYLHIFLILNVILLEKKKDITLPLPFKKHPVCPTCLHIL